MTKQKADYKLLVTRIANALETAPEELAKWVELSEHYIEAAKDLSKDELALIEAYLKRDLQSFSQHYGQAQLDETSNQVFRTIISNSIWEILADITDKTQLEWQEIFRDIEHAGEYHVGEIIGLGILECKECGHKTQHFQVDVLIPCIKCRGVKFTRKPL